jgi:hypothetical protein
VSSPVPGRWICPVLQKSVGFTISTMTIAGRELLGCAFALAVGHEQRLTSDLNGEERQQLLDLLARIGVQVRIRPGFTPRWGTRRWLTS